MSHRLTRAEKDAVIRSIQGHMEGCRIPEFRTQPVASHEDLTRLIALIDASKTCPLKGDLLTDRNREILQKVVTGPYSQPDIFNGAHRQFRSWATGLVKLGLVIHWS